MQKIGKYLIIAFMVALSVYAVLFVIGGRSVRKGEAGLESNIARNTQNPQLVAGLRRSGIPFTQNRVCPVGAAQFASGDHNCNFCHRLSDVMQNLAATTHHYANIAAGPYDTRNAGQSPFQDNPAASQPVEPFPDPQQLGYAVALPAGPTQAPPIMWGAECPHVQRGICTDCHEVVFSTLSAQAPSAPLIKWGARPPHGKRGICTDCHKII